MILSKFPQYKTAKNQVHLIPSSKSNMKFALFALALVAAISLAQGGHVVCYFTSWTVYRPGNGKFNASNVDPNLCTHLLYGFVGLGSENNVVILDDWEANGLEEINHLMALKNVNPDLKILVSMGGWNEGSGKYSNMAKNPASRAQLATNVVDFCKKYNFDGFDLDWEYPGQRDGADVENDPANFVSLLQELHAALSAEGLLLTAAVAGGVTSMDISYHIPEVSDALDMINVMAYDFHGAFEPFVGHVAPLYASHLDKTEDQKILNVAAGIKHWVEKGADPAKLNLGLALYGRSFTLQDPSNTELYAPTMGGGAAGPYTRQDGILGYNEICELHSDWTYVWDDEQKVPHKIEGNQWVGYENVESLRIKVELAKSLNLGGAMVWSLDTDDFLGICGHGKYPLLTEVNKALNS